MKDLTVFGAKIQPEKELAVLREFKEFALRGNVVDLAVGVVIGAAFGNIVTSLVRDIIMPPIGKLTGGVNFKDRFINLDHAKMPHVHSLTEAQNAHLTVIAYGQFLTTVVDFVIIAFCIFLVVKMINRLKRHAPPAVPPPPPEPTREEKLLAEIRDLLKARS
ncbi:MAG: mscL [Pedosphaera sp.]|nr:mscL [Pedosphaera sp.]